jgi:hypothetical protein
MILESGPSKKWIFSQQIFQVQLLHLANLLATMILLAFLMRTGFDWLDWFDERYRVVNSALTSRRTFFENVQTLLLYLPFDSWDHLLGLHA